MVDNRHNPYRKLQPSNHNRNWCRHQGYSQNDSNIMNEMCQRARWKNCFWLLINIIRHVHIFICHLHGIYFLCLSLSHSHTYGPIQIENNKEFSIINKKHRETDERGWDRMVTQNSSKIKLSTINTKHLARSKNANTQTNKNDSEIIYFSVGM